MTETFRQDVRNAFRVLNRSRGFAVAAVVMLALGIGAVSTIFSFINGIMLRPLPYPRSERLVVLDETSQKQGVASMGVSYPNFLDWRERNRSFEDIACYDTGGFAMAAGSSSAGPEQISGAFVNQGLFEILDVAPILGRTFTAEEDQPVRHIVLPQAPGGSLAASLLDDGEQVVLDLDVAEERLELLDRGRLPRRRSQLDQAAIIAAWRWCRARQSRPRLEQCAFASHAPRIAAASVGQR